MWSLFGYAVVFVLVIIALHQLWFMRKLLFAMLIFGTLAYFITNFALRNTDMSEGNVKKTTQTVIRKIKRGVEKTTQTLDRWEKNDFGDPKRYKKPEEPEKDEGFVTE